MSPIEEFDRQIENLVLKGYPKIAGITEQNFRQLFSPLKNCLETLSQDTLDLENGHLPFVIVVKNELVSTNQAMSLTRKNNQRGITKLYPLEPLDFKTVQDVMIPSSQVYLLLDIDRGKSTLNQKPSHALNEIISNHRSPLTIDEGVAIITHYPEFLMKNNCFSLLASRHEPDQRVPAIWINGNKQPNLGWCWNGNPHTWLGSASCSKRIGA